MTQTDHRGQCQNSEGKLKPDESPVNGYVYGVIIWECIVSKRLVQICIEEHSQILYIV